LTAVAAAACGTSATKTESAPDATSVVIKLPDAGPKAHDGHADASTDAARVDASRLDASKSCALADAAFDAGSPGTHAAPAGAACRRDIDCAVGTFCVVVNGTCAPASLIEGPGSGGHSHDGGACVSGESFGSCDPTSLAWTDAVDLSTSAGSLAECDSTLVTDGHGKVVVAWTNNTVGGNLQTNGLAFSTNDGESFTPGIAPVHAVSDAENDAALAIDATGLLYYVWEGYAAAETGAQHVYASTSMDAVTWTKAQQIDAVGDDGDGGSTPLDFPSIAINPVNRAPYFTYQITSASGPTPLRLVVGLPSAGDSGTGSSVELDDGTRPNAYRDLANGTFDASGSFYAAWVELSGSAWASGQGLESGAVGDGIFVTRVDLGASGARVPLGHDVLASGATEAVAFGLARVLVTPDASSLYVLYTVGKDNALDLRVATSHDRGATFLPSVKVNDDATCATHFKAGATLDANGRLWAAWYDNRDGRGHIVYSVSDDGAASFHPNHLVTPVPMPFETFEYSVGWLGDYLALSASKSEVYLAWPDPRANDQSHVQFAKAALPGL